MQFSFSSRLDTSASLLGLAALAVLGLAAAPAHAQTLTLNSGDSLTVSGMGTVGIQNKLPVANTTSTYDSGPGSMANQVYAVQTNGTSTFTLANGGTLNAGDYSFGLDQEGSGAVTITGGSLGGGVGGVGLKAAGSGLVTISGGTFSAIYGTGVVAQDGGTVTITGGTFNGGGGYGLFAYKGTINLFSQGNSAFKVDGMTMNDTTLSSTLYGNSTHTLTGTLFDGEALNTTFYDSGTINLNVGTPPAAVPEASTTVSLGLLLTLGLGGVLVARKKAARAT